MSDPKTEIERPPSRWPGRDPSVYRGTWLPERIKALEDDRAKTISIIWSLLGGLVVIIGIVYLLTRIFWGDPFLYIFAIPMSLLFGLVIHYVMAPRWRAARDWGAPPPEIVDPRLPLPDRFRRAAGRSAYYRMELLERYADLAVSLVADEHGISAETVRARFKRGEVATLVSDPDLREFLELQVPRLETWTQTLLDETARLKQLGPMGRLADGRRFLDYCSHIDSILGERL